MLVPYRAEGRQPQVVAVCSLFTILSPTCVALRIYARRISSNNLWWDDYLILPALPLGLAMNAVLLWELSLGFGACPSPEYLINLTPFFQGFYASELLYNTALPFIKISILALYVRIFPSRVMKILVYISGIITLAWFIGTQFAIIFQCTPIRKAWIQTTPGTCTSLEGFLLGQAIPSIVTDVVIFILPLGFVARLRMATSRKFAISMIFLVGLVAVACSIARLITVSALATSTNVETLLYTWPPGNLWTCAELHVSLICACLPALRPVLSKVPLRVLHPKTRCDEFSLHHTVSNRKLELGRSVNIQDDNKELLASKRQKRSLDLDEAMYGVGSATAVRNTQDGIELTSF